MFPLVSISVLLITVVAYSVDRYFETIKYVKMIGNTEHVAHIYELHENQVTIIQYTKS
jgi:hypothetical protein